MESHHPKFEANSVCEEAKADSKAQCKADSKAQCIATSNASEQHILQDSECISVLQKLEETLICVPNKRLMAVIFMPFAMMFAQLANLDCKARSKYAKPLWLKVLTKILELMATYRETREFSIRRMQFFYTNGCCKYGDMKDEEALVTVQQFVRDVQYFMLCELWLLKIRTLKECTLTDALVKQSDYIELLQGKVEYLQTIPEYAPNAIGDIYWRDNLRDNAEKFHGAFSSSKFANPKRRPTTLLHYLTLLRSHIERHRDAYLDIEHIGAKAEKIADGVLDELDREIEMIKDTISQPGVQTPKSKCEPVQQPKEMDKKRYN